MKSNGEESKKRRECRARVSGYRQTMKLFIHTAEN